MTFIAPIRYYQSCVAYTSQEQLQRDQAHFVFVEHDD